MDEDLHLGAPQTTAVLSNSTTFNLLLGPSDPGFHKEIEKRHDERSTLANLEFASLRLPLRIARSTKGCELTADAARCRIPVVNKVPTDGQPEFLRRSMRALRRLWGFIYVRREAGEPAEWRRRRGVRRSSTSPGVGKSWSDAALSIRRSRSTSRAIHAIRGSGRKMPVNLVLVRREEEIGFAALCAVVRRPEVIAALKKSERIIST